MLVLQKNKDIKVGKAFADENSDRYVNFAYGEDGKNILPELGVTTNSVSQEKVELNFQ